MFVSIPKVFKEFLGSSRRVKDVSKAFECFSRALGTFQGCFMEVVESFMGVVESFQIILEDSRGVLQTFSESFGRFQRRSKDNLGVSEVEREVLENSNRFRLVFGVLGSFQGYSRVFQRFSGAFQNLLKLRETLDFERKSF